MHGDKGGMVQGRLFRVGTGRICSFFLAISLASLVILTRAQLVQSGFEELKNPAWYGPEGGGTSGGQGEGKLVCIGTNDFAHKGEHSIRLMIWDNGSPDAVSWADVTQILPCSGSRKVHVGAWLYFSSSVFPVKTNALTQLKIEYFEDKQARQLIPTHIFLSPPFDPAMQKPDSWQYVEAFDRAPQNASSMKFSVVMTGQRLKGQREAMWLDDMFAEVCPRAPGQGLYRRVEATHN